MEVDNNTYTVYMHISPSNKRYVGITKHKPEDRWDFGCGYRTSPHFYSAIKKYGWKNIKHLILYSKLNKKDAIKKEIELISYYNTTDRRFGYNITSGGDGLNGMIRSKETREKMSKNYYNVKGKNNPSARKVINLNTLEIFDTIREANKSINISYRNSSISAVCRGKKKYAGKDKDGNPIKWKYLEDYLN